MPYDPTLPVTGTTLRAVELRNQFTGLKDLINALPAAPPETEPAFTASEAALLVPGDKAKLDAGDTVTARDAAIATAIVGVPSFAAHYRCAGMLVDTAGDTASAVLRAWTRGNFGLTAPPYVEDSDDDTLYCRLDIADYTEPWDFPNVFVQAFSTEDDGDKQYFNPSAAPYSLLRLYVDDWHRWYVRVRLPRTSGPQAGLAFTVFAP